MMRTRKRVATKVDVQTLEAQARGSEDREAYVQLVRSDACRIGVTVAVRRTNKATFSIEVLFTSTNKGKEELQFSLNELAKTVKSLTERGYVVDQQGDGWLVAWKEVAPTSIDNELTQLESFIQKGARQSESW